MTLALIYPSMADNNFKKYYLCYRLQHKLGIIHNQYGKKYKDGEITLHQWRLFRNEWYEPRWRLVKKEILRLRNLAKNKKWNVVLESIFIEA